MDITNIPFMPPRVDNSYDRGRPSGCGRDHEASEDGSSAGRRCVYARKTNITKTIRRAVLHHPPRIGAEPHNQWFPAQSSSHYFQKKMATAGARGGSDENIPHNEPKRKIMDEGNGYEATERKELIPCLTQAQTQWREISRNREVPDVISREVESGSLAGRTNMSRHTRTNTSIRQLRTQPQHPDLISKRKPRPSFFDRDPAFD